MFDLASEFVFSFDRKDGTKNMRAYLLLDHLEKYVNGAIIEIGRLIRVRKALGKDIQKTLTQFPRKRNFHLTCLANDVHFYFICIDKVHKLLSSLSKELTDPDIENSVTKLDQVFDIVVVRDHLEHIEQRLLGRFPREDKGTVAKNDLGNFWGDDFSFGGKRFPSGVKSINELKNIYTDLIKILERKYASKDPSFIKRRQSERVYKKIVQKLKKSGLVD